MFVLYPSIFPRSVGGKCDEPDGVAGPQADPLGDGAVLLLRPGELLLGAERLLALCVVLVVSARRPATLCHSERLGGGLRIPAS